MLAAFPNPTGAGSNPPLTLTNKNMNNTDSFDIAEFPSLRTTKPQVDSAPLRALEARLARIEFEALTGGQARLALPAPSFPSVPVRCLDHNGGLRDLMPNPIEHWVANEPIFGKIE